ncbi:MAG: hypothetical protein H6730_26900 [Deltaproteobacteria bacterium]|nr:hypothetical protein [Deltaproteobacteria bacterium]
MRTTPPLLVSLILTASAAQAASEDDRAFLASDAVGALTSPKELDGVAAVQQVCEALTEGLDPARDPDDPVPEAVQAARRAVYRLVIPPKGFEVGPGLQLRLERPLVTFGGSVTLVVLDRSGGTFDVPPATAPALARQVEEARTALEVVFRLEGTDSDLSPCFGHPKSGARGLRAEPLSYALLDAKTGAVLARIRTRHLARLTRWLRPGAAQVEVDVQAKGGVDPAAARAALDGEAARACLEPVASSPAGTGMASLSAQVDAQGRLTNVKAELDSFADEAVARCLVAAVAQARLPRGKRPGSLTARFAVERGDE